MNLNLNAEQLSNCCHVAEDYFTVSYVRIVNPANGGFSRSVARVTRPDGKSITFDGPLSGSLAKRKAKEFMFRDEFWS